MNALAPIALAGTTKAARAPEATGTPFDELLPGFPAAERERALLLQAGAAAVYSVAGYVAVPGMALPEPAAAESLRVCPAETAQLIGEMLGGQHADLLHEALHLLAEANLRLPPALLPAALAVEAGDHRAALRPVLGERGRWLSRFNPGWSWAVEVPVETVAVLPPDAETLW